MYPAAASPEKPGVSRHVVKMRGVARRILGREDLADDAVQEALITAHTVSDLPHENLEAWLVRTVTNRSLAARRASLRRRRNEGTAADYLTAARRDTSPETELAIKQLGDQIDRALCSLPPEQRWAFLLREVQGLSYRQISRLQRVPIGTVRSRLNRARIWMRDRLRETTAASFVGTSGRRPAPHVRDIDKGAEP